MISKLKLHYNEGCINVIADESVYWSDKKYKPLTGKISVAHLPYPVRYLYTGKDATGIISLFSDKK